MRSKVVEYEMLHNNAGCGEVWMTIPPLNTHDFQGSL